MQLQRTGGASLATLYHLLTEELLSLYRQAHSEFTNKEAIQLLLDLQTLALAMMREGVAQTTEDSIYSILGHFPKSYLVSGML